VSKGGISVYESRSLFESQSRVLNFDTTLQPCMTALGAHTRRGASNVGVSMYEGGSRQGCSRSLCVCVASYSV